jgi:hypothetical protein
LEEIGLSIVERNNERIRKIPDVGFFREPARVAGV